MNAVESDVYCYEFANDDQSLHLMVLEEETPENLAVTEDLFEYLKEIADAGAVTPSNVNDMFCMFMTTGDGENMVAVFAGGDRTVSFVFTNMKNAEAFSMAHVMLSSLQKADP